MKLINIGIANLCVSDKLKMSHFNDNVEFISESKDNANDFLQTIKNSPLLVLEFKVFNNIENKEIDNDLIATRYIDSNIKLFETYTVDEINEEHNKLLKFIDESIVLDNEKVVLYNSITNLIVESISDNNSIDVDEIHESFINVLSHIKKNKKKEDKVIVENNNINEDVVEIAINKFNEKYSDLDIEDRKLLKNLINSSYTEKKKIFEEYKTTTIDCFNKLDVEKYQEKIILATDRINEMTITKDTIDDTILKLHELKKGLL